jgi:hypothetical protein
MQAAPGGVAAAGPMGQNLARTTVTGSAGVYIRLLMLPCI